MDYQEFQEANQPDPSLEILAYLSDVSLDESGTSATYTHRFKIKNLSSTREDSWSFAVPATTNQIEGEWAKDNAGGLQTAKSPGENGSTDLVIKYRSAIPIGGSYDFEFGYKSPIKSLVTDEILYRNVVFFNWFVHAHRCRSQEIRVQLPSRARLLKASPSPAENGSRLVYTAEELQPEQPFTFLLGYRSFRVGSQFLLWLASAVGSGGIGYLISLAGA